MTQANIQLGKQGITDNFINSMKNYFKYNDNVKVSVLKGAGHERTKVKDYSEQILDSLGKNYTSRVVGFTIFVKKWRKAVRD